MGGLRAAAPLLVLVLATPALAADGVPLAARVEMDRDGFVVWTIDLAGATRWAHDSRMSMHGDFGAVGLKVFDEAWQPRGGSGAYAYADGPGASLVVGPVALFPSGSTRNVATGGGSSGAFIPPQTGRIHVVAYAASTDVVRSWWAEFRADNATLVSEDRRSGGTFAFTSRLPPPEYEGGIVGAPPPTWPQSPPEGETRTTATGTLIGSYIVSRRDGQEPEATMTTPLQTVACPCALEDTADGPGDYVFRFSGTKRGDVFLAGVDATLGR